MSEEVEKPVKILTAPQLFLRATLLSLLIAFLMLLVTALVVAGWGYSKFHTFLSSADISQADFIALVKTGWEQTPTTTNEHKNILVLGLDSLEGRGDVPPLTDTMMLVSIDFKDGSIATLPLPRDLWNQAYQTKINALYSYGKERYPENPAQFPKEVVEEMAGIPIHHTVVVTLDQLQTLIDMVGGVEINVPEAFTDTEFPRSGVDVTIVRDPAILYETVSFEAGPQHMDGETALKYIRSRKSEGDQGTDQARGNRQQQVISSLAEKLIAIRSYWKTPRLAGELFKLYQKDFGASLPLTEALTSAKSLWQGF